MSISVFDHPLLAGLLGDEEARACFSVDADIAAMLAFEGALAGAEAAKGIIPAEAGQAIARTFKSLEPDLDSLREATARDGVVVPTLVAQLRKAVGEPHAQWVHFGATSQDVIDTGLALRLKTLLPLYEKRLDALAASLERLEAEQGATPSMAHTRMQAAIPVTASRKIASWRQPLLRHRVRLAALSDEVLVLHFAGPAGTLEKLGGKGVAVGQEMAVDLGLRWIEGPRHSERDGIVALASWLSLVTGSLGKMGQDIALMAQTEIGEVRLSSGGGSSAMPHKHNPIAAETLVTLARFNATLVSGMHHALVHENERSGAAWTLEWMLLPQMAVATAAALRTASGFLDGLQFVAHKG